MSEDWIKEARRLRIAERLSSRAIAKRIGVTRDQAAEAIADLVPNKPNPPWHEAALKLHRKGLSPAAIGERFGKGTSAVHSALKGKGVTPHRSRARSSDNDDPQDARDILRTQCKAANDDFLADLRRYHGRAN